MRFTYEQQIEAFWNKVVITADDNRCWLWNANRTHDGYGLKSWNGKMLYAHRIAWSLPNYVIPDGMFVLHSCDNPSCVNPKHLFLGTKQDNSDDMMKKGRNVPHYGSGDNSPVHKLNSTQVKEIRSLYSKGNIRLIDLARQFNVSESNISLIVNYITWFDNDLTESTCPRCNGIGLIAADTPCPVCNDTVGEIPF